MGNQFSKSVETSITTSCPDGPVRLNPKLPPLNPRAVLTITVAAKPFLSCCYQDPPHKGFLRCPPPRRKADQTARRYLFHPRSHKRQLVPPESSPLPLASLFVSCGWMSPPRRCYPQGQLSGRKDN